MPHTNYTNPMGTQQEYGAQIDEPTDPMSWQQWMINTLSPYGSQAWTNPIPTSGVAPDPNALSNLNTNFLSQLQTGMPLNVSPSSGLSWTTPEYAAQQEAAAEQGYNLPYNIIGEGWGVPGAQLTPEDWIPGYDDEYGGMWDIGTPTGAGGGRRPSGSASLLDYLVPSQLMTDIKATRASSRPNLYDVNPDYNNLWSFYNTEVKGQGEWQKEFSDLTMDERRTIGDMFGEATLGTEGMKRWQQSSPSNIWSQEGVLSGMETIGEKYITGDWGDYDPLTTESVRAFKPSDFAKLHPGYYTKSIMEPGREIAETSLAAKLGQAATAGKGIAGYGRRGELGEAAKTAYGREVEGLHADVDVQRGGALQNIYDILGEWEGMSDIYGG